MSLVVFLIAYVIRRRLDRADHLAGDEVWRSWFHRWSRVEAGQEGSVWKGMMLVALPSLALAGALVLSSEAGYRYALYPLELVLLVMLMRSEERRVGKECRFGWSPGH